MKLEAAIEIIKTHNKWRKGAEIEQTDPINLGLAIDLVVNHYENNQLITAIVENTTETNSTQKRKNQIAIEVMAKHLIK